MGPGGEVSTLQTSSSLLKKQRKKRKNVQVVSKHLVNAKTDSVAATTSTVECKTPQQSNGYDCGLYVLAITKAIYKWSAKHLNMMSENSSKPVTIRKKAGL